jgi:alpha,alpha-trehalose-phosphate synthase [UDP-forming]
MSTLLDPTLTSEPTHEVNPATLTALQDRRLVLVSNREPYSVRVNADNVTLVKNAGGLVSALDPVLQSVNGLWVCWEGLVPNAQTPANEPTLGQLSDDPTSKLPYSFASVPLSEEEINHYYYGYANTRIWPLFHYFTDKCNFFEEKDWPAYQHANEKFAQVVVDETTDTDLIWVHDYHLFLVPQLIREKAAQRNVGFFCHIPFPHVEIFRLLPSRNSLLKGLLGSDLIGFHTKAYVDHFLQCVETLLPPEEAKVDWRRNQVELPDGRRVQVGAFPISIDAKGIEAEAAKPAFKKRATEVKKAFNTRYLGVGVDRLDYSKGILERLETIRVFFEKYPAYLKQLSFVQIAAPTRTEVPMYAELKRSVEEAVGRINGQFSADGWVPIHYYYRSLPLDEIIPLYMAADFALVNPLRDGMNLVCKEYCMARYDNQGALLLSELTGAVTELKEAFIVNPYHLEATASAIDEALQLTPAQQTERMKPMRDYLRKHDIHFWVQSFLEEFVHVVNHGS